MCKKNAFFAFQVLHYVQGKCIFSISGLPPCSSRQKKTKYIMCCISSVKPCSRKGSFLLLQVFQMVQAEEKFQGKLHVLRLRFYTWSKSKYIFSVSRLPPCSSRKRKSKKMVCLMLQVLHHCSSLLAYGAHVFRIFKMSFLIDASGTANI